jgi:hypothetical protein
MTMFVFPGLLELRTAGVLDGGTQKQYITVPRLGDWKRGVVATGQLTQRGEDRREMVRT